MEPAELLCGILDEILQKLRERFEDPLCGAVEDSLRAQIKSLLQVLQSGELLFHLELCAPVRDTNARLSAFEKQCVDYSLAWGLSNSDTLERHRQRAEADHVPLFSFRVRLLLQLIQNIPPALKAWPFPQIFNFWQPALGWWKFEFETFWNHVLLQPNQVVFHLEFWYVLLLIWLVATSMSMAWGAKPDASNFALLASFESPFPQPFHGRSWQIPGRWSE